MKIGIIGSGRVGGTVGKRWAAMGHEVVFGSRDPGAAKVKELAGATGGKAKADTIAKAAASAEVVVLATPWAGTKEALAAAGDLAGKIVIDCTNPLKPDLSGLAVGPETSAGEQVASWAKGARVVKGLSTTGSGNMENPKYGGQSAAMFICGEDAGAKKTAGKLMEELGFEVVDCGPLAAARQLEHLALLWVCLAYKLGNGADIAFRLLRR
ncbi:MAG: F420-dependent NADP oxidoreductase [Candidatus Tectomicrobia bacterium RIFCSPLOWO2_12_FULL_69_37]|nr:MAG: F420-dependent NADP oxidoreductase [Candidatus Tectomicrobia bacterium RIFCSPLOWO2_02_FULL_70_19]OGL65365.1 MAG: F420-dependent NADP oxidoreductase [Candidatus Tectomicrobia bacterium RIFCSPLOWO2_12_FULL_69_37]